MPMKDGLRDPEVIKNSDLTYPQNPELATGADRIILLLQKIITLLIILLVMPEEQLTN